MNAAVTTLLLAASATAATCTWYEASPSPPPWYEASPSPPPPTLAPGETCSFAQDGGCDDGGPGSEYDLCELNTDFTDCGRGADAVITGRRLEVEHDETSFATTFRRLSEAQWTPTSTGTEGGMCSIFNMYIVEGNDCGAFSKKSSCWKDSSEYASSLLFFSLFSSSPTTTEICCAASAGDCCEPDAGILTGVLVGCAIGLCTFVACLVMCCIFLPCCKCCPCNKSNKRGVTPTPSAQQPNPGMAMQPVVIATPMAAATPMVIATPMAVAMPTA